MLRYAKECVNSATTVIPIAMTSLLAVIIAPNWIKLLLSAMLAVRKMVVAWTRPIIEPRLLIAEYRTVLIESRTGINISSEDLTKLDELVSPLIL